MLTRMARITLAVIFLFLISPITASSLAQKLRITSIRALPYYELPLMAMEDNRLWAKQGLKVEYVPVRTGTYLEAGLLAGDFQMAVWFASSHIISLSRGIPTIIVADLGGLVDWYLWVRGDKKVTQPKELEGGRIATTRFGSVSHAYVKTMVKGLGLKRTQIVALSGIREILAGLRAGAVDAILMSRFAMARLEAEGIARTIASLSDHLPTKEWDPTVLVVVKPLVSKEPATVKRIVAALLEGTSFVTNNAQWSIRKITEAYGHPPKIAETVHRLIVYSQDGRIHPEPLAKLRDFLIEHSLLGEKMPPLEEAYTSEFLGPGK